MALLYSFYRKHRHQTFIFIISSTKVVELVIFWKLVNKHSQSLTTTKTNDCEISFRAIRSSPAKTHCIHMHEIACLNTCYESGVMQWIILTACNNATVSFTRLGTIVKMEPCGNMLVNCHVWIIKHYTWTLKLAYYGELQAESSSLLLVFPQNKCSLALCKQL